MEKFCIGINGAKIRYVSEVPLKEYYIKNKDFLEFFDAQIIDDDSINHTITYYNTSINTGVEVLNNRMVIRYPFDMLSESILLYMGYHLLEKQFGEQIKSSCHSACICKNGEATLLIGEAGAGKTSIAINLCENYGFSLISNDMTLIGIEEEKLMAYGGTKFINLRYLSVEKNMKFLSYLFESKGIDSWNDKICVLARNLGYSEEYKPIPITNIIFVRLDNNSQKIQVTSADTWRNNFLLYQNLSSHIRGSAATFIDKNGHPIDFIPSFETRETYFNRKRIIDYMNSSESYSYVNGNLEDILNYINSLYLEENKVKVYQKRW